MERLSKPPLDRSVQGRFSFVKTAHDDVANRILLAVTKSVPDVAGILHRPGMKALTVEEMDAGIARAVIERDTR